MQFILYTRVVPLQVLLRSSSGGVGYCCCGLHCQQFLFVVGLELFVLRLEGLQCLVFLFELDVLLLLLGFLVV